MATLLSPSAKQKFFDSANNPAARFRLYTYAANSTTPQATYSNRSGSTPNANPIILDVNGEATIYLTPGVVYDYELRTAADAFVRLYEDVSAQAGDAAAVSYVASGAGAIERTVQAKGRDTPTVEDYGAIGDGVTNDWAAFTAMATANAGRIVCLDKTYLIGTQTLSGYAALSILGRKMPRANAALTQLTEGTILVGALTIRCNDVTVADFGVCGGSARGLSSAADGLVIDAVSGQTGNRLIARNIANMGANPANPTHGFLAEGWDFADIDNVYVGKHRFGHVYKGRNAIIRNIDADQIDTAACYIKSDVSAFAGGTANGTVANVQVRNVRHRAAVSNTIATAVTVHASTASCANVQVAQASITYGANSVQVLGPGTVGEPPISSVVIGDAVSDSAQGGVLFSGYNYDCTASDVKAINPRTGRGFETSAASANWKLSGLNVLISDNTIVGTNCASLSGTGQWDNIAVRNPYATMVVSQALTSYTSIVPGQYSGNAQINGEANLTFNNLVGAGTPTPRLRINPGGVVELAGQLNCAVATGTAGMQAATLPISISGPRVYLCAGKTGGGVDATCVVRINGTALFIDNTYTGYQYVDLSSIVFRF